LRVSLIRAPDASWLPPNTVASIVVSDLNRYLDDSKATALGRLVNAEPLRPFFQNVWNKDFIEKIDIVAFYTNGF
jgi:hypothetical protein